MKTLLIHLDGLPDKSNSIHPKTPLEIANHPNLDRLVNMGLFGNVDYKIRKPDTDKCTLRMLGYTDDVGRGFIDSLGVGAPVNKGWVYLRCNFSYVTDDGRIKDRRAGRDSTGLDELVEELNGMEINGVIFHLYRVDGDSHRLMIAMEGDGLSSDITPNDSKEKNAMYKQIGRMSESARKTASALNSFLRKSRDILNNHSVNKRRKIPANAILVRNSGSVKELQSFEDRYNMKAKCIAFVVTIKGVAKLLGMDVETSEGATGSYDTDLNSILNSTFKAFEDGNDFVLLHVDGADIASHDNKFDEKVKFIERLDGEVFERILNEFDLENNRVIITSDHITETGNYHVPGPVPFLCVGKGFDNNNLETYTENESAKGISIKGTLFDKII